MSDSNGAPYPGRGTPGKEIKSEETKGFKLLGHCDFGGENRGDIMQALLKDNYLICGHVGSSGAGTSIIDVSNPRKPVLVNQIAAPVNTHTNKVQIVGDILIVNNEQFGGRDRTPVKAGIDVYDLSKLPDLKLLSFFHVGGRGVHRMCYFNDPYAFITAGDDDYIDQFLKIIDLSNPEDPQEVGRWALPGMRNDEERNWIQAGQFNDEFKKTAKVKYVMPSCCDELSETFEEIDAPTKRATLHLAMPIGDRCYGAWWDSGFIIHDISDISKPEVISHTQWPANESSATHSVLPLLDRDLCVVSDECTAYDCDDIHKNVRILDISDEKNPKTISTLPTPEGDFIERGGRFGPHNIHENREDSFKSSKRIYHTYFNAGLRVFDIEDAENPKEIAYYVPETPKRKPRKIAAGRYEMLQTQIDDVFVAENELVYITERMGAGIYILEPEF